MPPSNTRSCQHAAKHKICAQHAAYRHNVSDNQTKKMKLKQINKDCQNIKTINNG